MPSSISSKLPGLISPSLRFLAQFTLLVLLVHRATASDTPATDPAAVEFFEREIRPLLVQHCNECHGDVEQPKGGLKLTSRSAILKGGDSGPAAVAGKPDESLLIEAVEYGSALAMPPKAKLSQVAIDRFTTWVKKGLPWPDETRAKPAPASETLRGFHISDDQRSFWSFQPVKRVPPPAVCNEQWPQTEIDRYILAELERHGLSPAARADKRKLIRRATYDLTGLPPTPAEVEAFLADDYPDAFAKVVDRLLASAAYGERWGRHWLDVVRYADSRDARYVGAGHDITEAWRYRDWVVSSLNRDLPFNEFVLKQVAGDLLPPPEPGGVNAEGLIATGFLAIGEWGTGDSDAAKMHTDMVDDQVNVVCRAFLGLTVGCARCHDHKFDPISTADYYGLAGIFFSSQIATPQTSAQMVRVPIVPQAEVDKHKQYMTGVEEKEKGLANFIDEQYVSLMKASVAQTARYLMAAWDHKFPSPKSPARSVAELAAERGLREDALGQWLAYLGWQESEATILAEMVRDFAGNQGALAWRAATGLPIVVLNTTSKPISVPGTVPPHSLAVHPSQTHGVAVAWRSPIGGTVRIEGRVADSHSQCGDGVDWTLEHRRAAARWSLASGSIGDGGMQSLNESGPLTVDIQPGDSVRLVLRPKANHGCDMTMIDLEIREPSGASRIWNVARDTLREPGTGGQGSPHADSYGNSGTWSFLECPPSSAPKLADSGRDSLLREWFAAVAHASVGPEDRVAAERVAAQVQGALETFLAQPPATDAPSPPSTPAARLHQELISAEGPFRVAKRDHEKLLAPAVVERIKSMTDEVAVLKKDAPPPLPLAIVAREGGVPGTKYAGFNDARIHIRGRYDRLGDVVPRRFPEVLAGDKQPPITAGSGRLELGRWLARDEHPLTPRVIMNRVWLHHFGTGLVRTPGNFGFQGEPPTHPELLDYLAHRFVKSGWSLKSMHRLIMLSAVYQQSTQGSSEALRLDAENRFYARANIRRLEAEAVRDTLLAAAGTLDLTSGGPAVRDPHSKRRALYCMTIRSVKSGLSFLFDVADPESVVDQRTISTVAPQALFLLNNEFAQGVVPTFTQRVRPADSEQASDSISRAYALLYARHPTEQEVTFGKDFVEQSRDALADQPGVEPAEASRRAWEAYCQALLCTNELIYID